MKIFGFLIQVTKVQRHQPKIELSEPICKLYKDVDSDYMYLADPNGVKLPKQLSLKYSDGINQQPKATIELYVKVVNFG